MYVMYVCMYVCMYVGAVNTLAMVIRAEYQDRSLVRRPQMSDTGGVM